MSIPKQFFVLVLYIFIELIHSDSLSALAGQSIHINIYFYFYSRNLSPPNSRLNVHPHNALSQKLKASAILI